MDAKRLAGILFFGGAILLSGARTPRAQTLTPLEPPDAPARYPAAIHPRRGPSPPPIALEVSRQAVLAGAPSGQRVVASNGRVLVPIENGGSIGVSQADFGGVTEGPPAGPLGGNRGEPSLWVLSADGKWRFRTRPEGRLEAERRGRWRRSRWRSAWTLRVPAATLAPPLVEGTEVYFGSADNLVYCVRRRNGHRVWAVDLEDRVTRPLALWDGTLPLPSPGPGGETRMELKLLLVVADSGAFLSAIDLCDGKRLATFQPTAAQGRLVTAPTVLADGTIAVASRGYAPGTGTLLALEVKARTSETDPGQKPSMIEGRPPGPSVSEGGVPHGGAGP